MRFQFGRNWEQYSRRALTADHVVQARSDFSDLFDGIRLGGKSFVDLGFGQGLSLLIAAESGARTSGCDLDPVCAEVLRANAAFFPEVDVSAISVVVGSLLDQEVEGQLRSSAPHGFDVVHSWGVLHHTGAMWRAIEIAAGLVAANGHLILAIYNQHWTSPFWHRLKWLYCRLPPPARRVMVGALYPIIWTAKLAVTKQNPRRQQRGMDFYHDVVDWVGGYPYEYSAIGPIRDFVEQLGFRLLRSRSPRVPTGCNEFVFARSKDP